LPATTGEPKNKNLGSHFDSAGNWVSRHCSYNLSLRANCFIYILYILFSRENEVGESIHPLLIINFPEKKPTSAKGRGLQHTMRIKKSKHYYNKQVTNFQSTLHPEGLSSSLWHRNTNPSPGTNARVSCSANKSPHACSLRCSQPPFTAKSTSRRQISATTNQRFVGIRLWWKRHRELQ